MRSRPLAVRPTRVAVALALLTFLALALAAMRPGGAQPALGQGAVDEVVFVGNNWDGTASVLDPAQGYDEIGRINTVPDQAERELEIMMNPMDLTFFLLIRQQIGEGNDQLVDDMYTTPGGELLIISRPSYRDVVALDIENCVDLANCEIAWRFQVDGNRSDHMAISPDGSEVAVSASTGNVVHILETETGSESRQLRVRRLPAREHLFGGRRAPVPREHRAGLRAPPGRRRPPHQHDQGRAGLPRGRHRRLRGRPGHRPRQGAR